MKLLKILFIIFLIYFIRRFIQLYRVMKAIEAQRLNEAQKRAESKPSSDDVIEADFKVIR